MFLNPELMLAFFLLMLCLVLVGPFEDSTLLVFLAVPTRWQALTVYSRPKPESPPADYPIWPLWYVAWAFILTRLAGVLFIAGLAANAIYPVFL